MEAFQAAVQLTCAMGLTRIADVPACEAARIRRGAANKKTLCPENSEDALV
jgi:hypothetical protein